MADCFNDRLLIYEDEDTAKYIGLWLAEISVDNFLPPVQYPDHYDEFLNTIFPDWLPEYSILKNGIVIRRQIEGTERRMIEILCGEDQAYVLLRSAAVFSLAAANDIRKSLDVAREL